MELFLNLCWLALLLPAFVLWQRRLSSDRSTRASLLFMCALGCVLVLLFPVISASDDLHAIGQAMEESKRSLHPSAHCACTLHSVTHAAPLLLSASANHIAFVRVGAILSFSPRTPEVLLAFPASGRAPPRAFSL